MNVGLRHMLSTRSIILSCDIYSMNIFLPWAADSFINDDLGYDGQIIHYSERTKVSPTSQFLLARRVLLKRSLENHLSSA